MKPTEQARPLHPHPAHAVTAKEAAPKSEPKLSPLEEQIAILEAQSLTSEQQAALDEIKKLVR
jgi:hypothetical protein